MERDEFLKVTGCPPGTFDTLRAKRLIQGPTPKPQKGRKHKHRSRPDARPGPIYDYAPLVNAVRTCLTVARDGGDDDDTALALLLRGWPAPSVEWMRAALTRCLERHLPISAYTTSLRREPTAARVSSQMRRRGLDEQMGRLWNDTPAQRQVDYHGPPAHPVRIPVDERQFADLTSQKRYRQALEQATAAQFDLAFRKALTLGKVAYRDVIYRSLCEQYPQATDEERAALVLPGFTVIGPILLKRAVLPALVLGQLVELVEPNDAGHEYLGGVIEKIAGTISRDKTIAGSLSPEFTQWLVEGGASL